MSDRITVMHLRASNFVGGPEKQILEHLSRLDVGVFRPILCTFYEDGIPDNLREAAEKHGIECRSMPTASPLNMRNIFQLADLLRKERVDIVCTHGYKPNVLGTIASRITGARAIAVSRGWTGESQKIRLYESIDRYFLRYVDHVVAVSFGQRDKVLAAGAKDAKVSVIHNSINLSRVPPLSTMCIRRELGIPENAIFVASAGRLSPEKNYPGMIEAARIAMESNGNIYFGIFGEGVLRQELERQICAAGLQGRFLLPGFRKDLQSVLHDIDIFMLPSFTEGLPNVILEAFAVQKPVIATAVGGTPEVVEDGVSGFLTQPHETAAMAKHILQLVENPELRKSMGAKGFKRVQKHFDFEQQTREYEALYGTVHNHRHARPQ